MRFKRTQDRVVNEGESLIGFEFIMNFVGVRFSVKMKSIAYKRENIIVVYGETQME